MRCSRVEPWVYGFTVIKFVDDPSPKRCPLLCYRQCTKDSVVSEVYEGYVVHHCDGHRYLPKGPDGGPTEALR